MKKKVYLFDFDGTLTSADTLLEFIRYACGRRRFFIGFALFSPLLVLMKLHLYPNYRAKQRLFAWYFKGMSIDNFDLVCRRFAHHNQRLMRQKALDKLREIFQYNETLCVVSASIDNWVRPFFDNISKASRSDFRVIGTEVEVDTDGVLTGRFRTHNCYGAEKVRRVLEAMPQLKSNRDDFWVVACGDSRGDKELLEFADEAHFKPFR
ncbi:MAG: haloacid dehalogenase-like hydrolase [Prevotella sp.]|uniref:HAD family hydrolase n=1 Tax=Prevotella sp. TaxID=59823 RepID=UPI0025EAF5E6|nr:HAD family hydrolase [Prevotella sp.]MCI7118220.1 haloacid dehalogenase-like hydrolase [Prevotella sp.]